MKYKIFFFLFLLFFLAYLYISYLNPDNVKLYVGNGRYYEATVATYVAASFVLGVIISILASFFTDARKGFTKWRRERQERQRSEARDLFEKAKILEMRGETEKAVDYYNRVIKASPDMDEPYLLLAGMHTDRGEFERARQILDMANARLGVKEALLFARVKVDRGQNDLDAVERDLKEILKINEASLEAMVMLRDLYTDRRRWGEAHDVEKRVKKQLRTPEEEQRLTGLRYEAARERFEKEDEKLYEQILKDVREIIDGDKRFIPAYVLAAEVQMRMGKFNDAGRMYGRGFAKTGHVIFLKKMEELYLGRDEPGVILKIYRRLLDVAPKNQLLVFLYARLCLKLEMIDEAIDCLKALLAEEKEFRGLHRAMAEAYRHRGQLEAAVEEFSKAFPMDDVYIPFYCERCQSVKEAWTAFCGYCRRWNTVNIRQEGLFRKEAEDLRQLYEQDWGVA